MPPSRKEAVDAFAAANAKELAGPALPALPAESRSSVLAALRGGSFEAAPQYSASGMLIGISYVPAAATSDDFLTPLLQLAPLALTVGSWNLNQVWGAARVRLDHSVSGEWLCR